MKRLFDKVYFSSELLSDKVLVGGNTQNLIKFLVADTISATEVSTIDIKLEVPSEDRGGTPTVILDWETLTRSEKNENVYEKSIILDFTTTQVGVQAIIKIIDINDNIYYNHYDNYETKVL